MAPRLEEHYRLVQESLGRPAKVGKVACARVYHLNLVVKLKMLQKADKLSEKTGPIKLMHLERARLVVNRSGILRLEKLGRLATPMTNFASSRDGATSKAYCSLTLQCVLNGGSTTKPCNHACSHAAWLVTARSYPQLSPKCAGPSTLIG